LPLPEYLCDGYVTKRRKNVMDKSTTDLIEKLSSKVHDAWWDEKAKQGFHAPFDCPKRAPMQLQKFSAYCDHCHTDMYPYDELPENIKEYDRVTVRAVLQAMDELGVKLVEG